MKKDSEIQQNVMDELKWLPALNASEIGVSVKDGVVTLSGTVDSYIKKRIAERAAEKVFGVKAVAEDIQVKLFSIFNRNDTELALAVTNALRWASGVDEDKIKVKVEDGHVTLTGEAEWEFQKSEATRAIHNLIGVQEVTNQINVKPRLMPDDVKEKITSAYRRHAFLDSAHIDVKTIGHKVVLTGTVRSIAEKNDAASAAWAAPGVNEVENKLEVEYAEALVY